MKKRLLAAIMSLCMIVSLMPVSVLAEEPQLRRLNYWHYLYEYNPMTKEYVRVSGDQSSALHAAREAYGITPEHSSTNYAPIPEGVTVPQGNDNQVTINETYDLPQMTYTYEGVDYTWLCTGYEIDNVVHEWTEDALNDGIEKIDFSDKKNEILTIYYHWVQIDKLEENAPDNYETATFTFDYGKHIIDDDSQGPGPNVELTIPEGCDFSKATVTLYGADSKFDFPSEIRDAIDSESINKIGAGDGTFTASWPKGYYFTLDDLLKNQPNGYSHYYIKISCTPYEWYGHIEGWRDSAGKNFSGGVAGDESATFYARYHTNDAYFSSYVAAEGYTLVRIRNGNILKAGSDWSYDEFRAVRNQITVPDWNFPTYQIAVQNDDWKITVPSPGATSVDEEGAVLLSDGTYTWQCIGVQYEVYGETAQTVFIPHTNWETACELTIEDVTKLDQYGHGGSLDLEYVWQVDWTGDPPQTYTIKYDINQDGLESLGFNINDITRIDRVDYYESGNIKRYFIDYSGDSTETWQQISNTVDHMVNSTNDSVREGKTFTIDYPTSGLNVPSNQFYNLLVQNENTDQYFKIFGLMGEDNKIYNFKDTIEATDALAGDDGIITFKFIWEKIDPLSTQQLEKAENVLPLDVFSKGSNQFQNVLITQWTSNDENLDLYDYRTGDPVTLSGDETITYRVAARFVGGLASIYGSQGQNYSSEFAEFIYHVDVDSNLEFAELSNDGKVTLTFSAAPGGRYKYAPVKLVDTNIPNETIESTEEGKYTITFAPESVPKNSAGQMQIKLTLKWNGDEWQGSQGVEDTDATASMTLEGLVFKLKEGADVQEVNTSANITAKIDMKQKTFNKREYYETAGYLLGDDEWQTYFIGKATEDKGGVDYAHALPGAYAHAIQFMNHKLGNYDLKQDATATLKANTVTATIVESEPIEIKPADITVYEGGDGGYDAVVGDTGTTSSNSLPHPMFHINAPAGVNPTGLTFTNGGKSWTVISDGNDYYHFSEGAGQDKVRVTYSYTDEDDVKHTVTEDEFDPATMGDVYGQLTIELYPGENNLNDVTAKTKDGKTYRITAKTGTLTVRAVENSDPTSNIVETAPDTKLAPNTAMAVKPASGTIYTLNNTGVQLPSDSTPSLLFDDIIDTDVNRTSALKSRVDAYLGGADADREYQIKYLDLVDANNGNAWITSSAGTDIYWGYPIGTDRSTNFTLLHFEGLHRDGENSGFELGDLANITPTPVSIQKTDEGIKFHVAAGQFSPYALVWTDASTPDPNPGGGSSSGSGDSDPTGNLSIELDVNGGDDEFTFTVILTDKDGDDLENNFYYNGDYTGTIGSGDEITLEGGDKIVIRNLPEGTRYEVIIETADGYTYVIDGEEGVIHTGMNEAEFTATRTVPVADPSVTGVSRWLNTTDHIAYLTGYPGGAFGPDNNMTRAEVAQMFYALLNNKNVTITKTFPDVPADAWYATAVNTLASLGMVSGDEHGNYRPNDPITRAEFCVIALAFAYEPENAVCYFGDVSRSDWFYTYVAQAASYGWIGGYTNGNFGPNDRITRAQVTTIVNNMLGRAADRDYVIDHQADLVQFTDLTRAHWGYFQIMEATNAHDYTKSNGTENWR